MTQRLKLAEFKNFAPEIFKSELNAICGCFDVQSGSSVAGRLAVCRAGGIDIAQVGLDANKVVRNAQHIRRDPGNHYFLILQQEGSPCLSQGDVATKVNPGDMFLVDSTKACEFNYAGEKSTQLSLHLPRDEMSHRFGKRIYGGLAIDGNDALAIAFKATLSKLMLTDEPLVQVHVTEALYGVLGALLAERAQGNRSPLNRDRQLVQCAMLLIAEHFAAPDFNSQSLADLLGVSLRGLQRAFTVIDEKPSARIQRFRVEAARQALQSLEKNKTVSITSISYSCGFSDLSTFYRQYKSHFGCAPGAHLPQQ